MRNAILFLSFFLFLIWSCKKTAEPIPAPPTYLPISMYYYYDAFSDTASALYSTYYDYDNQNRLIGITEIFKPTNELRKEAHQYGQDGKLMQVNYSYKDSTGALKNVTKLDFFYDGEGKLSYINNGYIHPVNGLEVIQEQFRYRYDASGKLIERFDTLYKTIPCSQKDYWRKYTFKMSDSSYKHVDVMNTICTPPFLAYDEEVFFTNRYKNPFHFVKEYIPGFMGMVFYRNYPTHNYRWFCTEAKGLQGNRMPYVQTNTILKFKEGTDMPELIRRDDRGLVGTSQGSTASYYFYYVYKTL